MKYLMTAILLAGILFAGCSENATNEKGYILDEDGSITISEGYLVAKTKSGDRIILEASARDKTSGTVLIKARLGCDQESRPECAQTDCGKPKQQPKNDGTGTKWACPPCCDLVFEGLGTEIEIGDVIWP